MVVSFIQFFDWNNLPFFYSSHFSYHLSKISKLFFAVLKYLQRIKVFNFTDKDTIFNCIYYSMSKVMVIVGNTFTTFSLFRFSSIPLIKYIGLIKESSIFYHSFDIYRDNLVWNISLLNWTYSSAESIVGYDVVVIYKQRVRCLEILSITTNHYKSNQTFPLYKLFIKIEILIVIKLKFHPRPNEWRRSTFLSYMTVKSLTAVELIFQVKYFARLQRVVFERIKI